MVTEDPLLVQAEADSSTPRAARNGWSLAWRAVRRSPRPTGKELVELFKPKQQAEMGRGNESKKAWQKSFTEWTEKLREAAETRRRRQRTAFRRGCPAYGRTPWKISQVQRAHALPFKEDVGQKSCLDKGGIDRLSKSGTASELFGGPTHIQFAAKKPAVGGEEELRRMQRHDRYFEGAQAATLRRQKDCRSRRQRLDQMQDVSQVDQFVTSWHSTQANVSTSGGEVEYNALVRGAAEALVLKAVLEELSWELSMDIMIDSAAAKINGGAGWDWESNGKSR